MSTDAILNQSEPNWTEPQTCLACRNHALSSSPGSRLMMLSPASAAACITMLARWPASGHSGRNPAVSTVTVSLWVNLF